ncbi:hydrogenase expression/formation protein [Roseibium sp. MMSF_3544]|uniref:hydrogenase expression/formation protein n=1 Tax=unclassified Roseibium TaxID=2629323 RepID=UPI00273F2A76|nr:hydrogenase expression/formation protein [Roseibium sp. MMSF_3544]
MSTSHTPFPAPLNGPLVGPGSQPADEDGGELEYMQMPSGMMTFEAPDLPEPEDTEGLATGLAALEAVLDLLKAHKTNVSGYRVDLDQLDAANIDLVNQVLGEGEVSVIAGSHVQAQESVLAGVWRVHRTAAAGNSKASYIEVGAFPTEVLDHAFTGSKQVVAMPEEVAAENIFNAPPLIAEINEHVAKSEQASGPHVINLSLLPHTEEDLTFLTTSLERGDVTILSRGYGNCRISSTGTHNTWWVQFYNSQDSLILNTIEIIAVPEVACAAAEDIDDSAARLDEILEIYR